MVVRPLVWLACSMLVFACVMSARAQRSTPQPTSQDFSAEQLAALSNQQLRAVLTGAADRLCADLDRLKGGSPWKAFFKVDDLKTAMSEDERAESELSDTNVRERPVSPSERRDADRKKMLVAIADRLDKIAGDRKYRQIAGCSGFRTLQTGLREYTLSPRERQSHVLAANLKELADSLDRLPKGASWKRFLQLDQLERLATGDARFEPTDFARMAQILSRFETARQDPDYAMIVEQPGFDAAYVALLALFQQWE